MTHPTCSPHCIAVGIGLPDRGKVTFMWCVSEERARDLLADFTRLLGEPGHEFISDAGHVDAATGALFSGPGPAPLQVDRNGE